MRKFAPVKGYAVSLPERKTEQSSGYDISAAVNGCVPPMGTALVPTGIKAYMQAGEYLALHIRSSLGFKGIHLSNGTGIIDADYADNPDNEGHIMLGLTNSTGTPFLFYEGDRLAQGIFQTYLMTDDDNAHEKRRGGMGSTGV